MIVCVDIWPLEVYTYKPSIKAKYHFTNAHTQTRPIFSEPFSFTSKTCILYIAKWERIKNHRNFDALNRYIRAISFDLIAIEAACSVQWWQARPNKKDYEARSNIFIDERFLIATSYNRHMCAAHELRIARETLLVSSARSVPFNA